MIEQIEALMQEGKWDEVETILRDFVFNHPENPKGHAYLGICLEREGDIEKAADQYKRAWALEPHFWEAARKLWKCYDRMNLHKDALDTARAVHDLRPSDKEVMLAIERLEQIVEGDKLTAGKVFGR